MAEESSVFEMNKLTGTETAVPEAGADNHVGIEKSLGAWKGAVAAKGFVKGFLGGQQQDSIKAADHVIEVEQSLNEKIGINEDVTIGSNRTMAVGSNETVTVGKNRSATVAMNETTNVGLTRTHSVGVNEMINVGGAQELSVGGLRVVTVGLTQSVNVGTKHSLSAGTSIELSAPKITLQAMQEITIQCGAGRISINAAGIITIEGPLVKINC
jgi:hypothetical protein